MDKKIYYVFRATFDESLDVSEYNRLIVAKDLPSAAAEFSLRYGSRHLLGVEFVTMIFEF